MEQIEYRGQLREPVRWISKSRRIVFFDGVGVSTEGRIPDFRSADGFYAEKRRYPPEQIMGHGFFLIHTGQFHGFYKEEMLHPDTEPNAVHPVLAALERQGRLSAVITQNIDGLYKKAGNKRALSLHGTVLKNHCLRCGKFYSLAELLLRPGTVPHCDCGGIIKSDVAFYEETPDSALLTEAVRRIAEMDLLIVSGTSFAVYPTAGLLRYFGGHHLVVINRSATLVDRDADLAIQAPIGEVLSRVLEEAR